MEGGTCSKLRHGAPTSTIASSDCARYEVSPSKNWSNSQQADSMEEKEEGERLSEDDITTDECEKEDSSEEEGA